MIGCNRRSDCLKKFSVFFNTLTMHFDQNVLPALQVTVCMEDLLNGLFPAKLNLNFHNYSYGFSNFLITL